MGGRGLTRGLTVGTVRDAAPAVAELARLLTRHHRKHGTLGTCWRRPLKAAAVAVASWAVSKPNGDLS